jgi:hypothetical protein
VLNPVANVETCGFACAALALRATTAASANVETIPELLEFISDLLHQISI